MHGRRGTGVERRKRGHSWYQSSASIISFSFILSIAACRIEKVRQDSFFSNSFSLCSNVLRVMLWIFCSATFVTCENLDSSTSSLPSSFLHTPPGPAGSCPDTSSRENWRWHIVPQAQMRGCVPRLPDNRQLAPSFLPLHNRTRVSAQCVRATPPLEPCVVSVLANLWFSCEGHRSGRLTQFQLTDTIIHCLHWECWGCVRVAGTLPVRQPAWYFSAGSAETWPS